VAQLDVMGCSPTDHCIRFLDKVINSTFYRLSPSLVSFFGQIKSQNTGYTKINLETKYRPENESC
jgi:hypothetical protein